MRLHAIQYLRAIAALAVVYSHATQGYAPYEAVLPYAGVFGVDIFFVISGFIMVWIARDTDRPVAFFVNRVRRVVPLYWFFTLLLALIMLVLPSVMDNASLEIGALVQSLLFFPHWSATHPGEPWPLLAPGWSLNYEMYFYLLFAASLFLRPTWRVAFIIGMITLVYAAALAIGGDSALSSFLLETIVFEFALGMLLALAFKRGLRLPPAAGWGMILLALAWLLVDPQWIHILRYGIPALLIVAGCLYLNLGENKLGVLLGDSSYALYLSHIFVLGVLRKILPPFLGDSTVSAWLFVVIACLICVVAGIVVHVVIDNWLLRHERVSWLTQRLTNARATTGRGTSDTVR